MLSMIDKGKSMIHRTTEQQNHFVVRTLYPRPKETRFYGAEDNILVELNASD